jgi:protease-4
MKINSDLPRKLTAIRSAVYGKPWNISESGFRQMVSILEAHIEGKTPDFVSKMDDDDDGDDDTEDQTFEEQYGFQWTDNDVAIISVSGPIFPHANLMTRFSGATSLDELMSKIKTADALKPSGIILDCDSPGGSVQGLSDFCAALYSLAQNSSYDIVALSNDCCASAAYMIASQCKQCFSTDGAMTGSIGTIMQMDNWDRAEKNAGNDPVIIKSHELKGIGYGAATPAQMNDMERMVDLHFSKFKQAVSRARPNVDMAKVATGQMWMGNPANGDDSSLSLGLVDGIISLDDLVDAMGC